MRYTLERIAGEADPSGGARFDPARPRLGRVAGLVVDRSGELIACDASNHRIVGFPRAGGARVLAGAPGGSPGFSGDNVTAASSSLNTPVGLTLDTRSQALYFAEAGNHRIRTFSPDGRIYTVAGGGEDAGEAVAQPLAARLAEPTGLAFDARGTLFFTERTSGRLRSLTADGGVRTLMTFAPEGLGPIAASHDGTRVWVGDGATLRTIRLIDAAVTDVEATWEAPGAITALTFDQAGGLFACVGVPLTDGNTGGQIFSLSPEGARPPAKLCGSGLPQPDAAGYGLPVVPVPDPRDVSIAGSAPCSLFVDVREAASPDRLAGAIYFGNGHLEPGAAWSEIGRLTPVEE